MKDSLIAFGIFLVVLAAMTFIILRFVVSIPVPKPIPEPVTPKVATTTPITPQPTIDHDVKG